MGNLVSYTLPETLPPLTPEQKMELEEAKKLPFVYDEDCPPLTDEQLRKFRRVHDRRQEAIV